MRFLPYSEVLRRRFGGTTYKVPVSTGLTCPTWDGTKGRGGCAFCDLRGSSSYYGKIGRSEPVREQLARRIPELARRFGASRFLAYFQSYTNTYTDDLANLSQTFKEALSFPDVVGLCVGTRPDCLPDPVLDLLEGLARKGAVSLELGIQSFDDPTLEWLARGHTAADSTDALDRLARRAPSVEVSAHLIFGSPTEPEGIARESAKRLSRSRVRGVKLHQLMILEGTELARRYRETPFPVLGIEEYARRVAEFLDWLDPAIAIERHFATATHRDECLAPEWSRDRWGPHNRIREILDELDVRQGRRRNCARTLDA